MRIGVQDRSYSSVLRSGAAGIVAALCCLAPAAQAMAHGTTKPVVPGPVVPGDELSNEMFVRVEGVVRSRCALGSGGSVDMGDLTRRAVAEVRVGLSCNVPFVLRLEARNGAMVHSEMPGGQGGYQGRVAYGVDVSVPVINPSPSVMSGSYSSAQLRGGVSLDSANAIAAGGATVKFMTYGAENELLAGRYTETIQMTIQPKM